ncbi:hypothetical protein, partial [Pseudomonas savastanoi]|uniref:hypothetical protein n=1 Tax=Pseudomonas savastanoi TaxID=29438 RepID=UPI0011C4488A
MSKKIEESPITNESELCVALQIRRYLIKGLIHQCALLVIVVALLLTFFLEGYSDFVDDCFYEFGIIGLFAGLVVTSLIASLPAFFIVFLFIQKYTPFDEEIERYVNENPTILDRSSGTLSEQELSFLSS